MFDQVLAMLPHWPGKSASVDGSARQFRHPDFVRNVVDKVRRAGIAPRRLQIEITETAIFDDADRVAATLLALRDRGFRVAIDDVGTGYSSLYNIRTFTLDCLTTDRSLLSANGS